MLGVRTPHTPSLCHRRTYTPFIKAAPDCAKGRVLASVRAQATQGLQAAERATDAATLPGEIDIKLRTFIPAEAVKIKPFGIDTNAIGILPVIGGDARGFSYDEGNSRTEIRVRLITSCDSNGSNGGSGSSAVGNGANVGVSGDGGSAGDQRSSAEAAAGHSSSTGGPLGSAESTGSHHSTQQAASTGDRRPQASKQQEQQEGQEVVQQQQVHVEVVSRHIGTSNNYAPEDVEHVQGMPTWFYRRKTPDAAVLAGDTFEITDDRMNAWLVVGGPSEVGARIHVHATNPLIKPNVLVPATNTDLVVWFDLQKGTFWVKGSHDSFPCYELYINGTPVHLHDPIEAGVGPSFLAGPKDVQVDLPPAPIPAGIISQPVAS